MNHSRLKPTPSRYLRPIRPGEYDLSNISLMGHDPISGLTYEECHAEWRRELDSVKKQSKAARWWQIPTQVRLRMQTVALATHLGIV